MRLNCNSCGKFVSYKTASVIVVSNGVSEPTPEYLFFCQKCSIKHQIDPFLREPNEDLQKIIENIVTRAENNE